MNVPNWWSATLLALAAWRLFHLLAHDDILDTPRRYVLRLNKTWKQEGDATGEKYREKWALFLVCPYCAGFWIALAWWAAWQVWPHATLVAASVFAINAGVIGAQRVLSSE